MFEYKSLMVGIWSDYRLNDQKHEMALNEAAVDGWRVISVVGIDLRMVYTLEREKKSNEDRHVAFPEEVCPVKYCQKPAGHEPVIGKINGKTFVHESTWDDVMEDKPNPHADKHSAWGQFPDPLRDPTRY